MTTSRRRISGEIQEHIEELGLKGWSATQIQESLDNDPHIKEEDIPSLRTIQRVVAELKVEDNSGTWDWGESNEDIRPVLDVLRNVVTMTEGRVNSFTNREAKLVAKVREAAPNLYGEVVYFIVLEILRRKSKGASVHDIEGFLAFRPWENPELRRDYTETVRRKWIPYLPQPIESIWAIKDQGLHTEDYWESTEGKEESL